MHLLLLLPLLGRRLRAKCTETHLNYLIGRLSLFATGGGVLLHNLGTFWCIRADYVPLVTA